MPNSNKSEMSAPKSNDVKSDKSTSSNRKNASNPAKSGNPKVAAAAVKPVAPRKPTMVSSPEWWAPVMVTLMILGLIWIVVTYLMGGRWPLPIGNWNLAVGIGLMLSGFLMTINWR